MKTNVKMQNGSNPQFSVEGFKNPNVISICIDRSIWISKLKIYFDGFLRITEFVHIKLFFSIFSSTTESLSFECNFIVKSTGWWHCWNDKRNNFNVQNRRISKIAIFAKLFIINWIMIKCNVASTVNNQLAWHFATQKLSKANRIEY